MRLSGGKECGCLSITSSAAQRAQTTPPLSLPPGLVKEAPMEADKLTTLLVHGPLVPMAKEAYL